MTQGKRQEYFNPNCVEKELFFPNWTLDSNPLIEKGITWHCCQLSPLCQLESMDLSEESNRD